MLTSFFFNVSCYVQGGYTALHVSAQEGYLPIVEYLISLKLNPFELYVSPV